MLVSYFDWAGNLSHIRFGLGDTMRLAFQESYQMACSNDALRDLRTACSAVGIEKIARCYRNSRIY